MLLLAKKITQAEGDRRRGRGTKLDLFYFFLPPKLWLTVCP